MAQDERQPSFSKYRVTKSSNTRTKKKWSGKDALKNTQIRIRTTVTTDSSPASRRSKPTPPRRAKSGGVRISVDTTVSIPLPVTEKKKDLKMADMRKEMERLVKDMGIFNLDNKDGEASPSKE
ncbi:hypothetical protein N7492_010007 [Penicillium capsulatum]|uniref:Uncharacterized protein n=1 Tax=Penicillium capsulatum TaxID=69766 RepID=A0A9W9HLL8_9EURO|nr:hypothetical protein N7492_010007 [Penicillium capsulatum]KAJ6112516.1 hypothetical protein N7512_007840 [Penicillium capsulatum]